MISMKKCSMALAFGLGVAATPMSEAQIPGLDGLLGASGGLSLGLDALSLGALPLDALALDGLALDALDLGGLGLTSFGSLPNLTGSIPGLESGIPGLDALPVSDLVALGGPFIEILLGTLPAGDGLAALNPVVSIVPNLAVSFVQFDLPDLSAGGFASGFSGGDFNPTEILLAPVGPILGAVPVGDLLAPAGPILGLGVDAFPVGDLLALGDAGRPLIDGLLGGALLFDAQVGQILGL